MTDAELLRAAIFYFGGRARAAHILHCDRCRHDDGGEFVACPRCPGGAHGAVQHLRPTGS